MTEMMIDGVERLPLATDNGRWRRVVIQYATGITFWRMDDTAYGQTAKFDLAAKTITLSRADDKNWTSTFVFDQPDSEHLVFEGEFDGRKIRMETHLFDHRNFLQGSRGFNWIQELPFNR